jgi:hypothetical protein
MEKEYMLTTIDNPFDPFEEFSSWFLFDCEKGYYTCNKIARLANVSDEMSQKEANDEFNKAIDTLIENDFLNIYKRVSQDITENQENETNT